MSDLHALPITNGRIRLSVSTVNRTYELSGITHVTLSRKYGKHSTGPSTYGREAVPTARGLWLQNPVEWNLYARKDVTWVFSESS